MEKPNSYLMHREELRKALEKSFYDSMMRLGNKSKDIDWFAGNKENTQKLKAA